MNIRPKSIILFSFVYLLSPVVIVFQAAVVNMIPFVGPGNVFTRLEFADVLVLCLYFLCSVSIYSVRKWGWWTFIVSSFLLIVRNFIVFFTNPFTSLFLIIVYNILLTAAAGFFFRKHLIAPYFNPRLRIWEQEERFQIEMVVAVNDLDHPAELMDISLGGCFIRSKEVLPPRESYHVIIICQTIHISLQTKLTRKVLLSEGIYGYGMMFSFISRTEKTGLSTLLSQLMKAGLLKYAPEDKNMELRSADRYQTDFNTALILGQMEIPGHIRNISLSGGCLELFVQGPEVDKCTFLSALRGQRISCEAEVVWKSRTDDAWVYGIVFRNHTRQIRQKLKLLIKTVRILQARKREWNSDEIQEMIEQTLPNTPYKAVLVLKNAFSRN